MRHDKIIGKERVIHILKALDAIRAFTEGYGLDDFAIDERGYYACLYQFAVIGEAIVNVGDEVLAKYDYPWYKVRSFRNFIMHEYHAIDQQVVWDTIVEILPGFQNIMRKILRDEF
ncbi:MAG: HepT-like ribonuclease domain-containing protein [Bacteroidota bacterium]